MIGKIKGDVKTSPWDIQKEMVEMLTDTATPTYNGIDAGVTPYQERRSLDYGPIKKRRST